MDKWLDKLMDNRTFMKLVALVMAMLLFGSIYDSNNATNDINIPGEQDTETIEDIPIKSYYDTDNLIITGVPQTAKVTLKGPKPNLQNAKAQKEFEVYADLSKAKVGNQRVKLKIRNLSEKLTAKIEPEYVKVKVQEKVTEEFEVVVEFNDKMVAEGYKADAPIVKPSKVTITGGKEDIDRIRFVKASVETGNNLNSTVDKSAPVYALDKDLKKLNVAVEQETVRVTIPIKQANKKVPIEIVKNGTPPDGVTIDSIVLDDKEVKISGSEEALNATENVRVEVDVSSISGNTEIPLSIIIPDGIKEVEPKTVKAVIKVTYDSEEAVTTNITATKVFPNLPININGLAEGFSVSFQDPPGGKTSITVTGTNEEIEKIVESNFQLSFDAANLKEGEQEVQIQVSSPENTDWTITNKTARIIVQAKKLNDEETPQNEQQDD
jgi:YbbR domain-containing protein